MERAVRRQTARGDVEPGQDLDAADHRGGEVGGRAFAVSQHAIDAVAHLQPVLERFDVDVGRAHLDRALDDEVDQARSEEHTSELQSLMRISYAVFCLKKKKEKQKKKRSKTEPKIRHIKH